MKSETSKLWRHISGGILGAIAGIVISGNYGDAWTVPFLAIIGAAIGFWPEYVLLGALAGLISAWLHVYRFFYAFYCGVRTFIRICGTVWRAVVTGAIKTYVLGCCQIRAFMDGCAALIRAVCQLFRKRTHDTPARTLRRLTYLYTLIYSIATFGVLVWIADVFLPEMQLEYVRIGYNQYMGPPELVPSPFAESIFAAFLTWIFFMGMPIIFMLTSLSEKKHFDTFKWVQYSGRASAIRAAALPLHDLAKFNLFWIPALPIMFVFGIGGGAVMAIAYFGLAAIFGAVRGLYTAFTKHGGYTAVSIITVVTTISGWLLWDAIVANVTSRWLIALTTGLASGGLSYTITTVLSRVELHGKVLDAESAFKAAVKVLGPIQTRIDNMIEMIQTRIIEPIMP